MKRNRFFSILLYLSFAFLLIYLRRQGLLEFDMVQFGYARLGLSILLLLCGFIIMGLSWRNALKVHDYTISSTKAIYSNGILVFTKYIPGKIWTILGRASLAVEDPALFKAYSFVSLKEQFIYIWTGLMISIIPLLIFYGFCKLLVLTGVLGIVFSLFLFNRRMHFLSQGFLERILRKELQVPFLKFREVYSVILYCLVQWLFWMSGFYFFASSMDPGISGTVSFTFPISVTLGLLAIVFPGGLGVREGLLTGFMVMTGVDPVMAGTISVLSRLWFIAGELMIFISALILRKLFRNKG